MTAKDLLIDYDMTTIEGMRKVRDHLQVEAKFAKFKYEGVKKRGIVTAEEIKDAFDKWEDAAELYCSAERGLAVVRSKEANNEV